MEPTQSEVSMTIPVSINLPIKLEQGKAGLWYVTSPLVHGLLVAAHDKYEAIDRTPKALGDLVTACILAAPPAPDAGG